MSWFARKFDWKPTEDDARDAGDVDYGRVIHSASFRRLQGKTQILNLGDGDFYRTRLTHSIEVAQIAGSLARQLRKNCPDHPALEHLPTSGMIHAISSAHDLGHPPFGHGGEVALNYCMRGHGGFEGNGQTLRILSRLERFSPGDGANLTRRTLLGTLKYPASYSTARNPARLPKLIEGELSLLKPVDIKLSEPPKCYLDCEDDVVDWILSPLTDRDRNEFTKTIERPDKHRKTLHKSLDCSLMDIADDIAYGIHDLEDALALCLITQQRFEAVLTEEVCASFLSAKPPREGDTRNDRFTAFVGKLFGDGGERKKIISTLVGHFVRAVTFEEHPEFEEPLLRWRAALPEDHQVLLEKLKELVREDVIMSPGVQHLEFKGQQMVISVFEAFLSNPERLLPRKADMRVDRAAPTPRQVCDAVASMTDAHLMRTYERLFSPRMGSIFDHL